jgi:beta-xylosidase
MRSLPVAVGAAVVVLLAVVAIARNRGADTHVGASSDNAAGHTSTYLNPILDVDFPDPSLLGDDNGYAAFATGSGGIHIQVVTTTDLVLWGGPSEALPTLPAWVSVSKPETWGPAVVASGGRYVMLYAARHAGSGRHCVGAAVATEVTGPYTAESTPMLCDDARGGVIDPFVFVDGEIARLIWKTDGNCCGLPSAIWSQPIDLPALKLIGAPTKLLGIDQPWERGAGASQTTIEAPSMVSVGGRLYLFYSANGFATSNYAEGYAVCASPDGPCAKPRSTPVLASAGAVAGPGGGDVFEDRPGHSLIAYHAWDAAAVGYDAGGRRSMRIDRVLFDGDLVTIEGPTTTPVTVPAG